jgi:hypothetical protein
MGHRITDSLLKVMGAVISIAGVLLFTIGIGMTIDPLPDDTGAGPPVIIISFALILPGIFLYLKGRAIGKTESNIEKVISFVRSYRRISVETLSSQTGFSRKDVMDYMAQALSLKLIQGNFDLTTDEFFTTEGALDGAADLECPSCGAVISRGFLPGEERRCPACGSLL